MFTIPIEYSGKRFSLTCPVCGSQSWDRDGSRVRCCSCGVSMSVVNDTYFHLVLLYVHDCQANSPGDASCRPER